MIKLVKILLCSKRIQLGSACGSVGRAFTPETRCLQFESSHWHNYIINKMLILLTVEKTKIGKNEARNGPLQLINFFLLHNQETQRFSVPTFLYQSSLIKLVHQMFDDTDRNSEDTFVSIKNGSDADRCNQCDQIGQFIGIWATF